MKYLLILLLLVPLALGLAGCIVEDDPTPDTVVVEHKTDPPPADTDVNIHVDDDAGDGTTVVTP